MKLNEQIAFLRKEKGITQEELANALGVSNQAVSKWENGQNCPDIELLPAIAKYFNVSVDRLIGYKSESGAEELMLEIRSAIENAPQGEDFALVLRLAYVIHAIILGKGIMHPKTEKVKETVEGNDCGGWNTERAIKRAFERAYDTGWGLSIINLPEITTVQRADAVFFSGNKDLKLTSTRLRRAASVFRTFSDVNALKTLVALYELVYASSDKYCTVSEIAEKSGLSEGKVADVIDSELYEYLTEKTQDGKSTWGIKGEVLHIVPLLSMFAGAE